jgi:hypothetical protein
MAVNRAETERMDIRDDAHRVLSQAQRADAEAEELLTLKEFAYYFDRNYQALTQKARAGKWTQAEKQGGRWYVRVKQAFVDAARNRRARDVA